MARTRPTGTLRPDRLREELRRVLVEVVRDADEVIGHPRPTPASLHRLHRDMRRLRTALAIWGELLSAAGRARIRPLGARIQRLTRLVGQVRDRDVTISLLEGVADRAGSDEEREQLSQYRSRLEDDARTGRELLRAFLRSERQAGLFEHVGELFDLPPRPARALDLRQVLSERQLEGREKVVVAHRKARRRPSMDRLHRLRIRVRRLRQMSDLASTLDAAHDPRFSESLRRLQQHLGRLHDLDVLVHDLNPALQDTAWAAALRKERRRQRKAITKTLKSRKPGRPAGNTSVDPPVRSVRPTPP